MYLYLITTPEKDKFKIGLTTNPKKRYSEYKTHNPDKFCFDGIFKITNKEIERSIHMNLLKKGYNRCKTYKEWFEGNFNISQLEQEIKEYNERMKKCKLK